MKFQVLFTYDPEYRGYVAEVPDLPGCFSQGKTRDDALNNIQDAIKGYLQVLEKHGKSFEPKNPVFAYLKDSKQREAQCLELKN